MKNNFFKKIITPANTEKRNRLLKKLASLKKFKDKAFSEVKKTLRASLKTCDEKVDYFRVQKGLTIPIGDQHTKKKRFALYSDNRFLEEEIRAARVKKNTKPQLIPKYYRPLGVNIQYNKTGHVMSESGTFIKHSKTIKTVKAQQHKVPTDKDSYVGIELEYASALSITQVAEIIADHKLEKIVKVCYDGSIRTDVGYPHKIEICILTKFSDLSETLQKLKPIIFDKPQHFWPNESCGLHVHIDARGTPDIPKRIFNNLACMQGVLFALSSIHRRENKYCRPVIADFDQVTTDNPESHYDCISKFSYHKHSTIEVRIHQSTLDLIRIEKWIRLLKQIADYKGINGALHLGTVTGGVKDLLTKVNIETDLADYVQKQVGNG